MCARVCVRVRACVCVRACARACVRVCAGVCVWAEGLARILFRAQAPRAPYPPYCYIYPIGLLNDNKDTPTSDFIHSTNCMIMHYDS